MSPRVLAVVGSLALVACVRQRDVDLEIASGPRGAPAGFYCRAPSATGGAPYLLELAAARAEPCASRCAEGGECRATAFVFDFIRTTGVPSCRASSIASFCSERACGIATRRCFDVDVCVSSDVAATAEAADTALRAASRGVILEEAPDGPVLIRVVGVAQRCDEVARDGVERAAVFGCAYSCPVQLDAVEGTVQLDLDAFDDECGGSALACALFLTGQEPVPSP